MNIHHVTHRPRIHTTWKDLYSRTTRIGEEKHPNQQSTNKTRTMDTQTRIFFFDLSPQHTGGSEVSTSQITELYGDLIVPPYSSVIKSPNCAVIWFDHRTVRWFDCPRGSQLNQEDKVVCIIYNLSSFFTSRVCPRPWKKKNWHFTHTHL
jgi:hypothetical protein